MKFTAAESLSGLSPGAFAVSQLADRVDAPLPHRSAP